MQQMTKDATGASKKPETPPARLEEAFVLLDNSSGRGPPSQLFTVPQEIVVANTPDEVEGAFQRLQAGRAAGFHASRSNSDMCSSPGFPGSCLATARSR
jgi:hypothetical protein